MMKRIVLCVIALVSCFIGIQAQTQVIAHRGFWKTEGSAQNSIASLEKAAQEKLYGSEFDVQVTLDGKLIVNHDSKFQGFIIAETPYKELKKIKLNNGENIPTLKKYLRKGKKQDIQLILEIKSHNSKDVEDKMTADIVKMVKKMGLEKQVEYIAFSLNVCEQLAQLTPESEIAYLNGDIAPSELKKKGINGIDYHQNVFEKHPEWIKEAHDLGMKVNVWTVNNVDLMKKFIKLNVDYITTDQPLEVKELLP